RADTSRRACHIRLHSSEEKPEERLDFRHPDLLGWLRAERGRLLCAALTLLSAYCRAGRPDQRLKPWGSFEGWTSVVRAAVVWAGLEDPGQARMTLAEGADRDAAALAGLLAGWDEIDPQRQGMTAAQAIKLLDGADPSLYPVMREVLSEIFRVPN